jgi:NAD(P)H-dependent FMN reductase
MTESINEPVSPKPVIGVVSSSLDPHSRSARIAGLCTDYLTARGVPTDLIDLKHLVLERFDNASIYETPEYAELHARIARADGLILCTPIYNWSVSSELKRLIEVTGSTPPDGSLRGAWFDKVLTFAGAAGLPHSYMAFGSLANALMLDFKCIVNPYQLYFTERDWQGEGLNAAAEARLDKTLGVMLELTTLLKNRTYRSDWEL